MPASFSQRGVPIGALLLIAVGVVLLLQSLGVLSWDLWATLWRFWPVVLLVIGVNLLLGSRYPIAVSGIVAVLLAGAVGLAVWVHGSTGGFGNDLIRVVEYPLDDTRRLEARVRFGAGRLVVAALPEGSSTLARGEFGGSKASPSLHKTGTTAELKLEGGGGSFGTRGSDWTVRVSRDVDLFLDVDSGASDISLDLSQLRASELTLDLGASRADVVLPGAVPRARATVKAGAADVTLTVPEGVAARIDADAGLASLDVDTARFPRSGGVYVSPDYDTASRRVDLEIKAGAAKITVR